MKNFPIAIRLCLGFGCVVALTIALGTSSWRAMQTMDVDSSAVEMAYMPSVQLGTSIDKSLTDTVTAAKEYMAYSKPADLKTARDNLKILENSVQAYEELVNEKAWLQTLRPMVERFKKERNQYNALFEQNVEALSQRTQAWSTMVQRSENIQSQMEAMRNAQYKQVFDALLMIDGGIGDVSVLQQRCLLVVTIDDAVALTRIKLLRSLNENDRNLLKDLMGTLDEMLKNVTTLNGTFRDKVSQAQGAERLHNAQQMYDSIKVVLTAWEKSDQLEVQRLQVVNRLVETSRELTAAGITMTDKAAKRLSAATYDGAGNAVTLTMLATILALFVAVLLSKGITGPVANCLTFAEAVSGGDLSRTLTIERKDEIGRLSQALNDMVHTINDKIAEADHKSSVAVQKEKEALDAMHKAEQATARAENAQREGMLAAAHQLETIVAVVSTASTQLSSQIEESERGSAEQASRVTETATAMEEMNSTVLEVARNASAASDVSAATRQRAEAGAEVVAKAVESIQRVQSQSMTLKHDMEQLGSNAQAINQIMGVISDIADQTNLLALNAAIEAARAGDAGRGFAVVADEVRKLAEKTMASTTDVGNAIKAIQHSAQMSIGQVDEAVKNIEEATELASQSGQALGEIVSMVDSTADQVRTIATAAEEQSASSEEITQSIAQVNAIATETARAMQEAAQAVSELTAQSQSLAHLINEMKQG